MAEKRQPAEHFLPASACLECGKRLDAATIPQGDNRPGSGDFTVCLYCGTLLVFATDLTLRMPTDAELTAIAGDPRLLAVQRIRAVFWRQ